MTSPTPLDPTANVRRMYAAYLAGEVYDPTIATMIAHVRVEDGQVVTYDFSRGGGNGERSRVRPYEPGERFCTGIATESADEDQPVHVFIHAMVKGERVFPRLSGQ